MPPSPALAAGPRRGRLEQQLRSMGVCDASDGEEHGPGRRRAAAAAPPGAGPAPRPAAGEGRKLLMEVSAAARQEAAGMQQRAEEEARRHAAEDCGPREEPKARHDQQLVERGIAEDELRRSLEQEVTQERMEEEVLRLAGKAQRAQEEARQRLEEEATQSRLAGHCKARGKGKGRGRQARWV
eukprot:5466876-Lingulodinium_polyedra.AAC.1